MNKFCKNCSIDPDSHCFKKVSDKDIAIYYTKPGASKMYKDKEGILEHIDNMLKINKKKWICVVDGDDFDVRHATEFDTGMGIIDLLANKYLPTLIEIKIINPSWHIKSVIKFAKTWMEPEIFNKFKVLKDRRRSILEFI